MLDLHRDMRDAWLDARDHGFDDRDFDDERAPEPRCLSCGEEVSGCECSSVADEDLIRVGAR